LDTQPLCSQSLVDDAVRVDRRFAHDYVSMENAIELEVCSVIVHSRVHTRVAESSNAHIYAKCVSCTARH
jgi:hypothetical protein